MSLDSITARKPRAALLDDAADVRSSLRDQAYEAIKQRIITCQFAPGSAIKEAAIASIIGVGRTPVHQAVDRLRLEGMIEVIPRKGLVVKPVILQQALQMIEFRAVNEIFAARLAVERASDDEVAALLEITVQARRAIRAKDVTRMIALDRDFHVGLARSTGNEDLVDLIGKLNERSSRLWFLAFTTGRHSNFQRDHELLVDALARRDAAGAEVAMRDHIDAFGRSVVRRL